jgi:Raf kinase inhibitor-like YbhB/YbcL family protein
MTKRVRESMRWKIVVWKIVAMSAVSVVSLSTASAQAPQTAAPPAAAARPGGPPLIMTSTAWEDGGVIPDKYTGVAGPAVVSPELKFSQVPAGTESFVLLLHDPEPVLNKGSKMDITHWLIWNVPGTATGLPEGVPVGDRPDGSRQVSLRSTGYMGPGAPAGPYHHYTFELYALDTKLDVPTGTPADAAATRTAIFNAMDGHVLGKALLVARFHR